jgi:hypothetical protein
MNTAMWKIRHEFDIGNGDYYEWHLHNRFWP